MLDVFIFVVRDLNLLLMDRIVIEVRDDLARRWRNTDPQAKQKIAQEVDQFLSSIFEEKKNEFWPFLEQVRLEAESKGFNDEVLKDILNEK